MSPLISIIIPIYNSEEFLVKCLESVRSQTYKNLQIILVNDGSTDNSIFICDEYSRLDDRFTVINKEHSGVSSSRNAGLRKADGEYIGFIDSDDYIDKDMIFNLISLNYEKNADVLMCGVYKESLNQKESSNQMIGNIKTFNSVEALNKILDKNEFHGYVCNKLFSRKIIKNKNPILFNKNIHMCEDLLFCCNVFLSSKLIVYDSTKYYHYVFHGENTTSSFNEKKLTALDAYEQIIMLLRGKEEVDLRSYKTSYMQTTVSLLMQNIECGDKMESFNTQAISKHLYNFNISELNNISVKVMCIISRFMPNIAYIIWKTRKLFR